VHAEEKTTSTEVQPTSKPTTKSGATEKSIKIFDLNKK